MIAIAPPQVVEAQRLAAELHEVLAERKAAALTVAQRRDSGSDDRAAVAALHASTARIEAMLLRLEILMAPAYRLN